MQVNDDDELDDKTKCVPVPRGGSEEENEETPLRLQTVDQIRVRPVFETLPSFTEVDADGDGGIEFDEFKKYFPKIPEEEARKIFAETDVNHDGKLDREEYLTIKMRAYNIASAVVLPKNERAKYRDQYTCLPPPIFMLIITLVEIGFFIYHTKRLISKHGSIGRYSPAPLDSRLIYSPIRRYEVWRFLTYAFVHSGYMHIINNTLMQLALGILLEMVHNWWRVLIIYFAGVLGASLATSIAEPFNYLAGASGGVYALITAHLSTVILNWSEMEYPWVRVVLFVLFAIYDVGMAVHFNYVMNVSTNVGYPAHIGGAVVGLFIGILVLKNLKLLDWESVLWYISIAVLSVLTIFAVSWNLFNHNYFPPNDRS